MKLITLLFLLIPFIYFSQDKTKSKIFINEILLSVNKSSSTENKMGNYGYGLGVNRSFNKRKRLNFVLGVHYNQTSQFNKSLSHGGLYHENEVTHIFHNVSVPLSLRINLLESKLLFAELGGFIDVMLPTTRKYIAKGYVDDNSRFVYSPQEIKDFVWFRGLHPGIQFGVGSIFNVKKQIFIAKADFKFSLNDLNNAYRASNSLRNNYFQLSLGYRIISID